MKYTSVINACQSKLSKNSLSGYTWCHPSQSHLLWSLYEESRDRGDSASLHDDVIKLKHFPCYWPFVRGIHRSPVNFPHKGQWRGAFIFSLICTWINRCVNNREAGDSRRHRVHYDVIVRIWISMVRSDLSLCLWWLRKMQPRIGVI